MSNRLPQELAGELYCRANIDPMIYTVMNPQIATELLDRAWLMLSQGQISFSFNYIDKPKEGSGFFLKVQPDEGMAPHDGFQYMDDEVNYGYPGDARLSISERSQGFAAGDQYTHIVRRRYTLTQPGRDTLAFLHYAKAELNRSVVVDPRRARTPARQYPLKPIPGVTGGPVPVPQQPPQQGYPQGYRPQQAPPKMAGPYAGSPINGSPASPQQAPGNYGRFAAVPAPVPGPPGGQPGPQRLASVNSGAYGSQRHEKKSSHKKHQQQQQHQQPQMTPQQHAQVMAQQQAQAQEDAEEPSGDELDFLTAKDVAVARYKRNHDYIAEVFSPYPTSRIIPVRPEYQQSIAFLKSLSEKHNDDLEAAKAEHDEKIKKFKAEATVLYKGLEELKQATTVQEVFAANERVETFKGMTVQPYSALRQSDMPKDELSRTPELKAARAPKETVEAVQLPVAAVDGVAGGAPVAPVVHVAPVEPFVPAAFVEPFAPVALVEPVEPVASVAPVEPVASVAPVAPVGFVVPVAPVAPVVADAMEVDGPTNVAAPESTAWAGQQDTVMTNATESESAPVQLPASATEAVIAPVLEPTPHSPAVADIVMEEAHTAPVQATPHVFESNPTPSESAPLTVAQVGIPLETPMETPIETPLETPVAAYIETPVEATFQTPIDTPVGTPSETPALTPVVAPTEAPTEVPVEATPSTATPSAIVTSESPTPIASIPQPVEDSAMSVDVIQNQPVVAETFVQQTFTSSVGEGDHMTTTSSTSYTTSTTDAYGATVTDTTKSEGTTVSYADGHQELFPQAPVHQHQVEHSYAPVQQLAAQIEAAPGNGIASTVTVTELEPSSGGAATLLSMETPPAVAAAKVVTAEAPEVSTPAEQQVPPQQPAAP
ncbi:hypothetical protein BGX29_004339 [Mortierella sp. GBA35]|nr:hypothetical protein BGX29_004339 [Mortierella sp. GBA35]